MKFSLWLERKQKRNQKSAQKMPEKKSELEIHQRASGSRIHQMAGQGSSRTHGRAGSSDSAKEKEFKRSRLKQKLNNQLRHGDY